MIPGTSVLKAKQLQIKQQIQRGHDRNADDQAGSQQLAADLREETRRLEAERERTATLHAEAEAEHMELKRAVQGSSQNLTDLDWQHEELERSKDELLKEISRTQNRLKLYDAKIPLMRDEANDIHRRAQQIWYNGPAAVEQSEETGVVDGYLLPATAPM